MTQALIGLRDTGPTLPSQAGDVEIPRAAGLIVWAGERRRAIGG